MKRTNPLFLLLSLALPVAAAAMVAVPSVAFADPPAAQGERAPKAKTAVDGRFQRYLLNPHGEVQGLLLDDGTVVRMPERAVAKDAPALTVGDLVHVEGLALKTPSETLIVRALVQRAGRTVADARALAREPRHERHEREGAKRAPLAEMTAQGRIAKVLSTPKGGVAGLILDDGTMASVGGRGGVEGLGLKVGDQVTLTGKGGVYASGKAMRVGAIKLPSGETRTLPGHGHGHEHKRAAGTPA